MLFGATALSLCDEKMYIIPVAEMHVTEEAWDWVLRAYTGYTKVITFETVLSPLVRGYIWLLVRIAQPPLFIYE